LEITSINNKLGRIYSLKSKLEIESLFESGTRISSYPYTVFFKKVKFEENVPFKLVFSAPKRTFRFAHKRNRIKRLMKEAVRLNKHPLESALLKNNVQIAFFLIYSTKEEVGLDLLQKKTVKLFNKIIQQLNA
tara:strand:+ start:32494 stop:32892 length:399 start_codon:yes stop_codon:yes gene_type:complete